MPGGNRGAERLILQHIPTMDISYRDWDRPALDWEGREACWWWLSRMLQVAGTLRVGASADPVPNSPLRNLSAPNPLLSLSCSPLRVWSRSALPSDLNICKMWGGKKQESGCLSGAKTALAPKSLKILFNCLCLPCTWISWSRSLSRGSALCRAPALSRSWHPSSSSSPSAPALATKPAPGSGGGASQASLTLWEPRQAPSHSPADRNLLSPRSRRGFGGGPVRSRDGREATAQGWGLLAAAGQSILHLRRKLGRRLYT